MQIRRGVDSDAEAIARIARAAFQPYEAIIGKPPAPMTANFCDHLAHDTVFVVDSFQDISCTSKQFIGFAVLVDKTSKINKKNKPQSSSMEPSLWPNIWLEIIAISPNMMGRGIGGLLIAHIEAYLAPLTSSYSLYTNAKMIQNIAWYHRLGFEEIGRGEEDGFERVYFKKSIR